MSRYSGKLNQVRPMGPVDGVDGIIDRGVHDRKAAGRVDGCWLRARCPHNYQKCAVPLQNRIKRLSIRTSWNLLPAIKRSTVRLGDLYPETGAQERKRNQKFCHRNCPYCLCEGGGELVFSTGTSTEEFARTRGSAVPTMVFHWYVFSGFLFRRQAVEVGVPMNTEGGPNLFPTHNTELYHSFACSAL